MMEIAEIQRRICEVLPDAQLEVKDLKGTKDHFRIEIVSEAFEGKSLVEQHRMVQRPLEDALESGLIHALEIKTSVPEK